MAQESPTGCCGILVGLAELIITPLTAIVAYGITHSLFWSILDCIFWPVAWAKWLIFGQL